MKVLFIDCSVAASLILQIGLIHAKSLTYCINSNGHISLELIYIEYVLYIYKHI